MSAPQIDLTITDTPTGAEASIAELLDQINAALTDVWEGVTGDQGVGIANATFNAATGELTLILTDATEVVVPGFPTGAGGSGAAGQDGRGISDTTYDPATGRVTFTFTDNTTFQTGDLRGSPPPVQILTAPPVNPVDGVFYVVQL
ncbi:hypothetical protein [Paracoccus sp. (in: a-proteobacteria)]|uniref:hypothetical protein n=1 Tax=Paracoccus sp. TaxID=267 RepID=UPI00272C07A5|nr:hypothetical protein [Paracoccus sp. (in: a-proteobacteria)]